MRIWDPDSYIEALPNEEKYRVEIITDTVRYQVNEKFDYVDYEEKHALRDIKWQVQDFLELKGLVDGENCRVFILEWIDEEWELVGE